MTHPYDHNPYIAMLDTAQARIVALEAEKAVLQARLRALCDDAEEAAEVLQLRSPGLAAALRNSANAACEEALWRKLAGGKP